MERIIIETEDKDVLALIKDLAKSKKAKVIEEPKEVEGNAVALMNTIAANSPLSSIKDPVAWQREIREDRNLPFRD